MMKKYTEPLMKISMFDVETVSAEETTPLSAPVFGQNLDKFVKSNPNAVQRNIDFNDAIKFN